MPFYSANSSPLIVAHRGASAVAHENTLEAFEQAIKQGADAIELDLRITKDCVIVVHHDPTISGATQPLSRMTIREARELARQAGFELTTLEETLSQCAVRIAFDIELKEVGYEQEIVELSSGLIDPDRVAYRSFRDSVVERLKEIQPEVDAGLIVSTGLNFKMSGWTGLLPLKRRLKNCRADFVSPHWKRVDASFVSRMNKLGYPVVPWTIDDPVRARKLSKLGVSGLVTNRPDKIKTVLTKE